MKVGRNILIEKSLWIKLRIYCIKNETTVSQILTKLIYNLVSDEA